MLDVERGDAVVALTWTGGLEPDPVLTVSQWADAHRILSTRASAEPGPYRTARTPYLREIADCLSATSPVEKVVLIKAAQIGATELGNNFLGYIVHQVPGPAMAVQPTLDLAKRLSKIRIDPMFADSPELAARVGDRRSRDSSNTVALKEFPGGVLVVTGANSAVGLRSLPFRFGFFDELDAWPEGLEEEGDPLELARRGMRTFGTQRKEFSCSTPTIRGRSRIETEYLETDQREFHVPCPFCRKLQVLYWTKGERHGVRWPKGDPEAAFYVCEHCDERIEEYHKPAMLEGGRWIARHPERSGRVAGFHLNALVSPLGWYSWGRAAADFERVRSNPLKLRVWVNQTLGETWEEKGDAPPWETLYNRRESYKPGTVPKGALVLTAGADVQKDRIELEVVGWGRRLESWSVDYIVIPGDTAEAGPWQAVDEVLAREFPHELGGTLRVRMLAVDSGYATNTVYQYARAHRRDRVIAVKGSSSDDHPVLVGRPSAVDVTVAGRKLRRGAQVWLIGAGMAKRELYGWLRLEQPTHPERDGYPAGFLHFPQWPEDYFQQLTAEQTVVRISRGYRRYVWELIPGRRNEVLDARVYARIAAAVVGVDRATEDQWQAIEASLGGPEKAPATPRRPARREDYLARWRTPRNS